MAQPGEYERLNRPCATADGDTMLNYFDHLFKIVLVRVQAGLDRTIVKRSQVKDDDDHKPLNIARLKDCIMDINRRMSASRLKLNADKTELMIPAAGTKYAVNSGNACFPSLRLGADVKNVFVCLEWSSRARGACF